MIFFRLLLVLLNLRVVVVPRRSVNLRVINVRRRCLFVNFWNVFLLSPRRLRFDAESGYECIFKVALRRLLVRRMNFVMVPRFLMIRDRRVHGAEDRLATLIRVNPMRRFHPVLANVYHLTGRARHVIVFALKGYVKRFQGRLVYQLSPSERQARRRRKRGRHWNFRF